MERQERQHVKKPSLEAPPNFFGDDNSGNESDKDSETWVSAAVQSRPRNSQPPLRRQHNRVPSVEVPNLFGSDSSTDSDSDLGVCYISNYYPNIHILINIVIKFTICFSRKK